MINCLDTTAIKYAQNRSFTEFSDVIKGALRSKLSSHPTIQEYATKVQSYQDHKSNFAKIVTSN